MIYLDYQATTPLAPEALDAMLPWLRDQHANPHSAHGAGRVAKAAVEVARDRVAASFPAGGSVSFTSGATEALNWAIKGVGGPVVTLTTEHAAVLDTARSLAGTIVLPVGPDGLVNLDAARAAIRPGVKLVAAMLVNNEIGVIQPIAELATLAHDAGALFLCDAVQGYGRVAIPADCDLIAVSAHKIYGPKGIGALWIRDGVTLDPLLHGGAQEVAGRSGTLSPALCAGFGAAAVLMRQRATADAAHVEALWCAGITTLGEGWAINGATDQRYRGNLNIRRDGLDVARLMSDVRDIAFSAGSACASGSGRPSHVLEAIGLSDAEARSSIRIGFGRYTGEAELVEALGRIDAAARAQRGGGVIRVTFVQRDGSRREAIAQPGDRLLTVAQLADQPLEGTCEGQMACSTCHVIVAAADFAKLPPAVEEEEDMLDLAAGATRHSRLACQIWLDEALDGITVTTPPEARNMQGR